MGKKRIIYYSVVFTAFTAWLIWRALYPDLIEIHVHASGAIEINEHPVALAALGAELRRLDAAAPRKTVTISAENAVPAAQLVAVVEQARAAGVANPAFETLP